MEKVKHMKLAIIGDTEEGKEGASLRIIGTFVEDHKAGNGVVISAGSMRLLSLVNKYAREKGIPPILLQSFFQLAVMNADKVLVLHTPAYNMEDVVELCKVFEKPFMEIK